MSDSNPNPRSRTIEVGALARVEGEGALRLVVKEGHVEEARLSIYEPPRFFEALLRGRDFREVPDITARICGICPVAYQMGSCHALEKCLGAFDAVDPAIRVLRNLLYCGEWIESHALHMFMLHLPDFLGYESALAMAADHGPIVATALNIKKVGNAIVSLLGKRAVHPVGVCVGGFYAAPPAAAARELALAVRMGLDEMCELAMWLAENVSYPDFVRDYELVALCPEDEYPMNLGPIRSNKGLNVAQEEFAEAIEEKQSPHSTALRASIRERGPYMVGPLARLGLNSEKLHPRAAELLPRMCQRIGHELPWRNSFLSLPARAVETVHALALAADILEQYQPPARSRIPLRPRAGLGRHGTEAPRGLCWHEYRTNEDGSIAAARIIPPTSQNQMSIEEDLRALGEQLGELSDEEASLRCEHLIRNYDPCISCSVHFLRFERREA